MLQELISTLTAAGLTIRFRGFVDSISVEIMVPDIEYPRGAAIAATAEKALAIASARGLSSIYHRVRDGFISLEEVMETDLESEEDK